MREVKIALSYPRAGRLAGAVLCPDTYHRKESTPMQEEVENRSITLAINTAKLTARVLKEAMEKYLASQKQKSREKKLGGPVRVRGKQSVRQLVGQNQGVSSVEITDQNIKSFERTARKYGVDFALKKDRSVSPPKYLVFFKARDNDALTAAFTEYTAKTLRHTEKPSLLAQLKKLTAPARSAPARAKDRDLTL